jgi:hypothetical protein
VRRFKSRKKLTAKITIARETGEPPFVACVTIGGFRAEACSHGASPRAALSKALARAGIVVGERRGAFHGYKRRVRRSIRRK